MLVMYTARLPVNLQHLLMDYTKLILVLIYTAPAGTWIMVRTMINGVQYSQHYSDKVAATWQFMGFHDLVPLNAGNAVTLIISCASGTTGCDINDYTLITFALIG